MEFELGQTYEGYRFLELLRKSQDGIEYRVHNLVAQRDELLKVLPSFVRDDQDAAGSFLQEARILARLTHPHIIGFYAAQPIDGRMAMTTEWSGFVPLAARLGSGPLPCREALDAADQLLAALACLHEQNVVHLDITPETILYSPAGSWKLASFAKARVMNCVPLQGGANGNPRYISPEQVKGGTLDYRSDLYSLAAVLYEMLCGRPPFDLKSQFELMLAHVSGVPEPPSRYRASLPAELDDVLLRALGKTPQDRWASAGDFAKALRTAGRTAPHQDVATVSVEPVLFGAADESDEVIVAKPAVTVEPVLAVAAEEPVVAAEPAPLETAPEPTAETAVAVEPAPAVAIDEPVEVAVTAELVCTVAVDEPVEVAAPPTEIVSEPIASEAAVAAESVSAVAVDQPVEVATPPTEIAPEPIAAEAAVAVESVSAVTVDQPVEVATPPTEIVAEPIAADAVVAAESVSAVAVDQPVEAAAPPTEIVAEPITADAVVAAESVSAAVEEPVEATPPPTEIAAEPITSDVAVAAEPVSAVAVDQPVEAATPPTEIVAEPITADVAATQEPVSAVQVEPVSAIALEEAIEALAPLAASLPEPVASVPPAISLPVAEPTQYVHEAAEVMTPPSAAVAEAVAVAVPDVPATTAPDPSIPANLWAAARIVAQAAAIAPGPAVEPVTVVPVPQPVQPTVAVSVAAESAPSPSPATAAAEASANYPIRALVAAQQPPDSINWIMFGSSAAFLAIVIIAIFLGLR